MGSRAAEVSIPSSTFTHLFISCERAFIVGDNIRLEQAGIVFHRLCQKLGDAMDRERGPMG